MTAVTFEWCVGNAVRHQADQYFHQDAAQLAHCRRSNLEALLQPLVESDVPVPAVITAPLPALLVLPTVLIPSQRQIDCFAIGLGAGQQGNFGLEPCLLWMSNRPNGYDRPALPYALLAPMFCDRLFNQHVTGLDRSPRCPTPNANVPLLPHEVWALACQVSARLDPRDSFVSLAGCACQPTHYFVVRSNLMQTQLFWQVETFDEIQASATVLGGRIMVGWAGGYTDNAGVQLNQQVITDWPFQWPKEIYRQRWTSPQALADDTALRWHDMGGYELASLEKVGQERLGLIRYRADAPSNIFQPHGHPAGEEAMALFGGFADENGTYRPTSGWIRYPAYSHHAPEPIGEDTALLTHWGAPIVPL